MPRTWKGATTWINRGFLLLPLSVKSMVSEPRLTVPSPTRVTTSVSSTTCRAFSTPLLTSKVATAQRRSVCFGSLDRYSVRPGSTFTPISSAKVLRIWPSGIATAITPLEAPAALCTVSPRPCSLARASSEADITGRP